MKKTDKNRPVEGESGRFLRMDAGGRRRMWKRARLAMISLAALFVIAMLFGGDFGMLSLYRYSRFEKTLDRRIEAEQVKQDSLKKVLHKLQTDPAFVERLAREKLRMIEDGERIYRFEPRDMD